jgi:hypothetical protein
MGRKKALPVIVAMQFVADFDHVTGNRTVAYKAGTIMRGPSAELVAAAGARAVPYADEERQADVN